jgi:hypothetical protein
VRTAPTLTAIALLAAQQIVGDAGHTIYQVHDRTLRQTAVAHRCSRVSTARAGRWVTRRHSPVRLAADGWPRVSARAPG